MKAEHIYLLINLLLKCSGFVTFCATSSLPAEEIPDE